MKNKILSVAFLLYCSCTNEKAAPEVERQVDFSAPGSVITGGPAWITRETTAEFSFAGANNGFENHFECRLDGDSWQACTSPEAYSALTTGTHSFNVRAIDDAGNIGAPSDWSWTIDRTLPFTIIPSGPVAVTNTTAASFAFEGADNIGIAKYECRLDEESWQTCTSPGAYSALITGSHNFNVRAIDEAGNIGIPTDWSWTIDQTPPGTIILLGPVTVTNATAASFAFEGTDNIGIAEFECRLDDESWQTCTSPEAYPALTTGTHSFNVRAMDDAGNIGIPAVWSWTIDRTAPFAIILSGPEAVTNASAANFLFVGVDAIGIARYECRLDDESWQTCTTPEAYSALTTGTHSFNVRAIDDAANVGFPDDWSWTIDGTPPSTIILSGPAAVTNATSASFAFVGIDNSGVAKYECRLDEESWQPCATPETYSALTTGTHTFKVRAMDDVGNIGFPADWTWTIDRTPPFTMILSGPEAVTIATSAGFTFEGTDNTGVSKYECRLDDGAWGTCSSPHNYSGLASASTHVFASRAVDLAGNVDIATRSWNWFIGPFKASSISAGRFHSCAVTTLGGVKCWGIKSSFQLGNVANVDTGSPVDVTGLTSGVSVISSVNHSCVLTIAGGIKCWGFNSSGQLGDGTFLNRNAPVDVSGLNSGIAAISTGVYHSCALTTLGGIKCWGYNYSGQLGDGTEVGKNTPVNVIGMTSGIKAISIGDGHSCALTTLGGVKCWGINSAGQLGNGILGNQNTPVDVNGLTSGVAAISAGSNHTCALTTSGGVKCWGLNYLGQLGDGTVASRNTPVDVSGLNSGVAAISAGMDFTCTLTIQGGAKCWGSNSDGQLGDGTIVDASIPMDVNGVGSGIAAISAGGNHACAITSWGGIQCWGSNLYGELGNGTMGNKSTPVDVSGLSTGISAISTGENHSCALSALGGVKCWGAPSLLGDGTLVRKSYAVEVSGMTSGVVAITAGWYHECALTTLGGVKCWGSNSFGQLGIGTQDNTLMPVDVSGLNSGIAAVSAGWGHTCALTTLGGVMCWGDNRYGQLGDGTTDDARVPVYVNGLTTGVAAISAGWMHTCALTTSGGVKCWGGNDSGQMGEGTTSQTSLPIDVLGLTSDVAAISTGAFFTCALTTSGGVKCWGANSGGSLGDGTFWARRSVQDVIGMTSGVASISTGYSHACAVTIAGAAKCWGWNFYGQLGDGTIDKGTPMPIDVSSMSSDVSAISAGSYHTCAITSQGGAKCWGANFDNQLGDGTSWRTTPTGVLGFY